MFPFLLRLLVRAKPRRRAATPSPFRVLITSAPLPWRATLKELWQAREIGMKLIQKELTVQFKQTTLGVMWFMLRPMVTVAIFATIFRYIVRFPAGETPYAVFVMCGIVPWLYFSDALQKGMNCLQGNAHIITRIYFPRMLLPLSLLTAPLADLGIGLTTLILVMFLYGLVPPPQIVFLPFFILLIYLFALAVSLCMAGPQAIFRDIGIILGFFLPMWMYLTPVIYPLDILPPFLKGLLVYNPLTGIVTGMRWSVLGYGEFPTFALAISVTTTILLLIAGMRAFSLLETRYIDQV